MKKDALVEKIKAYTKDNETGFAVLAAACHLKDSNTPKAWLKSGHGVPAWHRGTVESFLHKEAASGNPGK